MKKLIGALVVGLSMLAISGVAQAATLIFKGNDAQVVKGTLQQIHVFPATDGTAVVQFLVGNFTGNGPYCVASGVKYEHALQLVALLRSGATLSIWCRTTTPNASSAFVDSGSYFVTATAVSAP